MVFGLRNIKRMIKSRKIVILLAVTLVVIVLYLYNIRHAQNKEFVVVKLKLQEQSLWNKLINHSKLDKSVTDLKLTKANLKSTAATLPTNVVSIKNIQNKKPMPCYNIHIFYYPWYGNIEFNKHYIHWNHKYLPHWSPEVAKLYPDGIHKPPGDIGSNFYPALGPYSSSDPKVIENHLQQLAFAGVGVIAVSYYPQGQGDENGQDWQHLFPLILNTCERYKIKVAFHIEPYKDRSEISVKYDIEFIIDTYSTYPSFYKHKHHDKEMPLVYIYDSYHTTPLNWAKVLKPGRPDSIRGTSYDSLVIGLVVKEKHTNDMVTAGFDGFYTYFAADGFTYGSTRAMWKDLNNFAANHGLLFIPSVGPGYIDTRIRPWNAENTKKRLNGKYYKESWNFALAENTEFISITSFNEWHEGSQIEKAVPKVVGSFNYLAYEPSGPDYYLSLTKQHVNIFSKCKQR